MDLRLSVPFAEDLTREAGWNQLDLYLYFVARFHLYIEQNQTNELAFGDVAGTFHTTPFSETEVTKVFEEEFTTVDLKETARSVTLSDDLSRKIAGTLTGAAKSPLYEVSADVGAALERTIRTSVGEAIRSSNTVSRREKKTFTVSQKIRSGAAGIAACRSGIPQIQSERVPALYRLPFCGISLHDMGIAQEETQPAAPRRAHTYQPDPDQYAAVQIILLGPGNRKLSSLYGEGI